MYLHGLNEWLTLTAASAAQTVKSPSCHWPPAPCWWRWCDFLSARRTNTVESAPPRLLLCFLCPLSGVLSPPNVYCLVVNAPRGAETLQADGQVTWGAPGSGRKTLPSHQERIWLVRPQLSVHVQLKQEEKHHTVHVPFLPCVCVLWENCTFYGNCTVGTMDEIYRPC